MLDPQPGIITITAKNEQRVGDTVKLSIMLD